MKELKFRKWNGSKMIYSDDFDILYEFFEKFSLDRDGFQQFTGLQDKNGKDVYEGDIIEDEDGYIEVYWSNINSAYQVVIPGFRRAYKGALLSEAVSRSKVKIIGNIFENPDLLK